MTKKWICDMCGKELDSEPEYEISVRSQHFGFDEMYIDLCNSCGKGVLKLLKTIKNGTFFAGESDETV
ncbi:MAG: hypothetical protein ACTSPB_05155 [Candidatus Thorarchaeota archaeon]